LFLIHDKFSGGLTVIPGVCKLYTEFVCINGFPVLPRRSVLFLERGYARAGATISVPLSLKSVFLAYGKATCFVLAIGLAVCFFGLFVFLATKPGREPTPWAKMSLFALILIGLPSVLLVLFHKMSFTSQSANQHLAQSRGMPVQIRELLLHGTE
jgi:hypothetical protein